MYFNKANDRSIHFIFNDVWGVLGLGYHHMVMGPSSCHVCSFLAWVSLTLILALSRILYPLEMLVHLGCHNIHHASSASQKNSPKDPDRVFH